MTLESVIKFGEDDSLIIHGEQAISELERFHYKESSGVRRLDRGRNGNFNAGWGDLFDSDEGGRVLFVRVADASVKNFLS